MFFSKRDLQFHLYEVLDSESLSQYEYFQDHNRESFDMVLDAAESIAVKMLHPLLTEMDRKEPQLVDGKIRIHEGMKAIIKKMGDDGWVNAAFRYDEGGQQLPITVLNAAGFIFQAANYSSSIFSFMSGGSANLIRTFGSQELIDRFTPNMYSGKWQGTMALTEPNAGSSLSDISTIAEPTDEAGVYKIKGQKIFISAGDHDACENVVHLMLAKIKGGPIGAKGISLFVVPQKRPENGELIDNDVITAGIFHKMGYKGAPIAHLSIGSNDGTLGYLVGEPHKGLNYMFQLMNEARIGVGLNATAIGTAAYHSSLAYAKERPQGRKISEKDPTKPQITIINHADVKRMLLFQKAVVEGSLGLLLFCSKLSDLILVETGEAKERAELLLDLLTPVGKSYPSEMCCLSTSAAVQVLGGSGYTTDFPVEQYYREARIHPIHEGTTAIHGLDLLGRKLTIHNGKAAQIFFEEVSKTMNEAAQIPALQPFVEKLQKYLAKAQQATGYLLGLAGKGEIEKYLADATLYLEMFGIITIAWQWLGQAIVAERKLAEAHDTDQNFYQGKLATLRYFYEYELVKVDSLVKRLQSTDSVTIEMQADWF
ncbi:acyl-CoA dehydrogenase domain-containing protein [Emticicia oligotrophica DSM 17448]|uniref:Acyl-CoA dehydrogenase domain-containing protein n=1 Tax=Emticicia oligotrophica (strain DSM 17448 / CIP 109782 / MTCC 6937 / GPTSA100-15) TaxID=929562 RepID=A0ABN4AMQ1_EMTOG|nr:acyl-CoA dehydrogenase [Emticicia oligotrophica]AFK03429.1 acyl-CoA dehydrogenase domain-containing protein [Emticicia oligotrophica DSM 17448]